MAFIAFKRDSTEIRIQLAQIERYYERQSVNPTDEKWCAVFLHGGKGYSPVMLSKAVIDEAMREADLGHLFLDLDPEKNGSTEQYGGKVSFNFGFVTQYQTHVSGSTRIIQPSGQTIVHNSVDEIDNMLGLKTTPALIRVTAPSGLNHT